MKRLFKLTTFLSFILSCCMLLNACFLTNPTGNKDSNESKAEINSQSDSFMMTASRMDMDGTVMAESYFVYDDNGNMEYEYTINSRDSCVIYSLRKSVYDEENVEMITQLYTLYDWNEDEEKSGMKDELTSYYELKIYDGDKLIWARCPTLNYEKEYKYDEKDQLIEMKHIAKGDGESYTLFYEYDENGDVTKFKKVDSNSQEVYNEEFIYKYDSSGRVIKENTSDYVYDAEGRLVKKSSVGFIEQYTYVPTPQDSRKNIELIEKEYDLSQIEIETEELVEQLLGADS